MAAATSIPPQSPYHEFYGAQEKPRQHYAPLWENIERFGLSDLAVRAQEAHLALHAEGVTFTVYSQREKGLERRALGAARPVAGEEGSSGGTGAPTPS